MRLGDFVTWNSFAVRDKSMAVEIEVDEIFSHQKKDLALVRLKETVTFTDVIRPVCLPSTEGYSHYEQIESHFCKRSKRQGRHADVTLESAVNYLTR